MKTLSISKAWDEASAFLGREMRLVMPVALAAFVIPSTVIQWIEPRGALEPSTDPATSFLLFLLALLITIIGQLTITALAIGWRGSVGEAMALGFRRVWGVVVALLLVFLPFVTAAAVAAGTAMISAGLTDPATLTAEAVAESQEVLTVLFLMSLAVIALWAKLFPMSGVAVSEGAAPFKLLARSWSLSKGHFWRLVATVLLLLIASTVLSAAVTYAGSPMVTLAFGQLEPFSSSALLVALLSGLASAAVSIVGATLVGRIYVQLAAPTATVPEVGREL
jgi:hypothetical protein